MLDQVGNQNVGFLMTWVKLSLGFPTRSDIKQDKGLKYWTRYVKGLYYQCSENKGADQLLFQHKQKAGFLMMWLNYEFLSLNTFSQKEKDKTVKTVW